MKKRIFTIFLVMILAVTNIVPVYAAPSAVLERKADGAGESYNALGELIDINLENYQEAIDNTFGRGEGTPGDSTDPAIEDDPGNGISKVLANVLRWLFGLLQRGIEYLVMYFCPMMDVIVFNDSEAYSTGGQLIKWGNLCRLTYFDDPTNYTKGEEVLTNLSDEAKKEYRSYLANSLTKYVSAFYQTFRYVALIGFIVAIACIAVKMIVSSVGKQKAQYKQALKNWLIGLILLVVGHWIMIYMIYFSDYLVKLLLDLKNSLIPATDLAGAFKGTASLAGIFSAALTYANFSGGSWILVPINATISIVAILMFAVMNCKILKVYLERVVVVGILIMIFPLVTVFYAFEKSGLKKGSTFETWLRTYVDQVFIQPIQALSLLGVMIVLVALSSTSIIGVPIIGVIIVLMALNTMFTIENTVKKVFAINGGSLGAPMDVMGAVKTGMAMNNQRLGNLKSGIKGGIAGFMNSKEKGWTRFKNTAVGAGRGALGHGRWRKNTDTMLGIVGLPSLPDFEREKLSHKEEMDASKRLKKVAAASDGNTVKGIESLEAYNNLERNMDPDLTGAMRTKCNTNKIKVMQYLTTGSTGNDEDDLNVRKYLAMLADPTVDISGFNGAGDTDAFNYYMNSDDKDIAKDLEEARNITPGSPVPDKVKFAMRAAKLKNPEQFGKIQNDLGINDLELDFAESGVTEEESTLKYKLLAHCYATGDKVDKYIDKSGKLISNKEFDYYQTHDDKDIQKDLEQGRNIVLGSSVPMEVKLAMKAEEISHPEKVAKYQTDSKINLSDATIAAVEDNNWTDIDLDALGNEVYGTNWATMGPGRDDILKEEITLRYKVMVDCIRTGNRVDKYTDDGGNLNDTIWAGMTMKVKDRYNTANSLVMGTADLTDESTAAAKAIKEKARQVLASFRGADETKFYNDVANKHVDAEEIKKFINGDPSACTNFEIRQVLKELMQKK